MGPDKEWRQDEPETFTREVLDRFRETLAAPGNPDLRAGISCIFSVLQSPPDILAESVRRVLKASEESGVPILITLDGLIWWERRPDLWNWWDPEMPGYDPENVHNVEWTGWSPDSAVAIGWRNWGSQMRVAPAQNIASKRVVDETVSRMAPLAGIIAEWYASLPEDRKFLFGGVKVGWEASIGYNSYFYPDGNAIRQAHPDDANHDPTTSLDLTQGLSGGVAQLGYAAIRTASIKSSGTITRDDIGKVVQQYLEKLAQTAVEAGVPRHKVFTHQGGVYAPWDKHLPFWPAVNEWSIPGWSFYAADPADAGELPALLSESASDRWAASEWWWGAADKDGWRSNFERTLRFRDCRFICVYNWNQGSFERETEGHQAVRELIADWQE
jgi:hypothetical protein